MNVPRVLVVLVALAAGLRAAPARAETGAPPPLDRLVRGLRELEFSGGYGFPLELNRYEGRTHAPFLHVAQRVGRFTSGRTEQIRELHLGLFTDPETEFLGGGSFVLRQHLTDGGRVLPYVEAGAGVAVTSLHIPELGGAFQFVLQAGLGVRVRTGGRESLTVGLRLYHLSNGGLREPNTSLNNALVTVGYSVFY